MAQPVRVRWDSVTGYVTTILPRSIGTDRTGRIEDRIGGLTEQAKPSEQAKPTEQAAVPSKAGKPRGESASPTDNSTKPEPRGRAAAGRQERAVRESGGATAWPPGSILKRYPPPNIPADFAERSRRHWRVKGLNAYMRGLGDEVAWDADYAAARARSQVANGEPQGRSPAKTSPAKTSPAKKRK
ncbi:hypothetical protein LTR36_007569 [Oleoguttula mirabilis]|uniref:Uncharacterized protein n=1 Tax=Oleoguttula mirabilis TaxID=1507867 RepID=A0AAV9JU98_9PEZI|nr:hypothetical protein LTR36_007569 [Oleoguttula mirabilis]